VQENVVQPQPRLIPEEGIIQQLQAQNLQDQIQEQQAKHVKQQVMTQSIFFEHIF
jgi:hypothetical protein